MQVNWERPITLLMILLKLVLFKIYFAAKGKKNKIKTKLSWGWWDHSVLKSLCCSGKERTRVWFTASTWYWQQSVIPVSRDQKPSLASVGAAIT